MKTILNKLINFIANINAKKLAKIQTKFDTQIDAHDMPSGATNPKNEFAGD